MDLISTVNVGSLQQAETFKCYAGGTVANLSANLHRLGYPVLLAACVGEDGFGTFLTNHLRSEGISRELIQTTRLAPTTLIPIAQSTSTPDFLIYRGADQFLSLSERLHKAAEQADIFHTSAFALSRDPARSTILSILISAHRAGKIISLDPNYHPAHQHDIPDFRTRLAEIYKYVTITKPSLDDSRRFFGDDLDPEVFLDRFLELGPEVVVLTLGDQGSMLGLASGARYHLQPNPVEVIDVTGAGDAFWSGLLAGWDQGLSPLAAAKLGQTIAEHKIIQIGPVLDHPPFEDYLEMSQRVKVVKL